jgi:energy-coupling factor transport system ATP-binding protein
LLAEAPPRQFFANIELLRENEVRPPEVTLAFSYLLNGRQPVSLPVTLTDALQMYKTMKGEMGFVETAVYPKDTQSTANGDILLQTDDLHYAYENGTQALQGISLSIRQGEYVAIVGQNGAGKSTLVRHFLHLLEATKGRVMVLGKDVTTYSVSDLAQNIGYISQNPDNQIFSDSVENEVAFALKNLKFPPQEVEKRVTDSLAEMKLEWAKDRHPLNLSKGDRSRIVIAAIMAMKPDILIFDEPTTGQDYLGARAILDLTRELHQAGKTIIVITHHLYLLPGYAQRLIVMGKGKVLLDGPLREVFYQTDKLRETYLTAPQVVQFAEAIQPAGGPLLRPLAAHELPLSLSFSQVIK